MSSLTPKPKTKAVARTMDFPDAIRQLINGKKIARISWPSSDYSLLKDGWLVIFTKNEFFTWSVNDGDLLANDWAIVGETN